MSATGKVEAQRGGTLGADQAGRHAHAFRRRAHVRRVGRRAAAGGRHARSSCARASRSAWTRGARSTRAAAAGGPRRRRRAAPTPPAAPRARSVDLRRGKVLARVGAAGALAINARDTRTTSDGPARFVVLADENGSRRGRDHRRRRALRGRRQVGRAARRAPRPRARPAAPPGRSRAHLRGRVPQRRLADRRPPRRTRRDQGPRVAVVGRHRARAGGLETAAVGADGQFSVTVPGRHRQDADRGRGRGPRRATRKQATTTLTRRPPPPPALTPEATDLWKKRPTETTDAMTAARTRDGRPTSCRAPARAAGRRRAAGRVRPVRGAADSRAAPAAVRDQGSRRSCCSRRIASSWTRCWTSRATSSSSRSG